MAERGGQGKERKRQMFDLGILMERKGRREVDFRKKGKKKNAEMKVIHDVKLKGEKKSGGGGYPVTKEPKKNGDTSS